MSRNREARRVHVPSNLSPSPDLRRSRTRITMSAAAELRQAFAAIRHSLRSLLPHRTVKLSPTQPVQLYFETKIPWYTQWYIAWPLIAFDVIFVCVCSSCPFSPLSYRLTPFSLFSALPVRTPANSHGTAGRCRLQPSTPRKPYQHPSALTRRNPLKRLESQRRARHLPTGRSSQPGCAPAYARSPSCAVA